LTNLTGFGTKVSITYLYIYILIQLLNNLLKQLKLYSLLCF